MPLNIDFQQILIHMLNLAILIAAVYFLLYGPIKNFIDKRKEKIAGALDGAEKEKAAAEKTRTDAEAILADADRQGQNIIDRKTEEANKIAEKIIAEANADAQKIIAEARVRAESESEDIIRNAKAGMNELAKDVARKVVIGDTSSAYDRFIEQVEKNE